MEDQAPKLSRKQKARLRDTLQAEEAAAAAAPPPAPAPALVPAGVPAAAALDTAAPFELASELHSSSPVGYIALEHLLRLPRFVPKAVEIGGEFTQNLEHRLTLATLSNEELLTSSGALTATNECLMRELSEANVSLEHQLTLASCNEELVTRSGALQTTIECLNDELTEANVSRRSQLTRNEELVTQKDALIATIECLNTELSETNVSCCSQLALAARIDELVARNHALTATHERLSHAFSMSLEHQFPLMSCNEGLVTHVESLEDTVESLYDELAAASVSQASRLTLARRNEELVTRVNALTATNKCLKQELTEANVSADAQLGLASRNEELVVSTGGEADAYKEEFVQSVALASTLRERSEAAHVSFEANFCAYEEIHNKRDQVLRSIIAIRNKRIADLDETIVLYHSLESAYEHRNSELQSELASRRN